MKTGSTAARELLEASSHCGDPKCDCAGIGAVYRIGPTSVAEVAYSGNVYLSIAQAVDTVVRSGSMLSPEEYLGAVVGVWIAPVQDGVRPSLHPEAQEVLMAVVCDGSGDVTVAMGDKTISLAGNDADGPLAGVLRAARATLSAK